MKKWALVGGTLALAASGIGWATLDDGSQKVVATAGANIRVIEATRNGVAGYELEISWSGRRPEDIAVLHVNGAGIGSIPLGMFRPIEAYYAASLVWRAGESGSTRIFWRPSERNRIMDRDFATAVLIFAPDEITIDHLEIPSSKTVGRTVASFDRKVGELDTSPHLVGGTIERAAEEFPDLPWVVTADHPNTTRHVHIGVACPCCEFHYEDKRASDRDGLRVRWKIARAQ